MDIVVSNRVARITPDHPMIGGLAAALLPAVKKSGVVWFGSSGNTRDIADGVTPLFEVESYGRGTIARVDLPAQHYEGFYAGFANSALWPLLHSRPDIARATAQDYAAYREVNAYMARTLAAFAPPQSTFWIHDYHFLTLASELRKLGVRRKIGFFLHTPWAERRVMTGLPQWRELADAMLAYDLIGFQTDRDRDNFAELLRQDLRIPGTGLTFDSRHGSCRLATFPIGIDAQDFAERAQEADTSADVQRLRASLGESKLVIGVDRVDYSKGLEQRLQSFDLLLARYPALKRRLSLLQIATPSRSDIDTYRNLQADVARMVGEINGRHGEVDWTPVRYVNKGYCQSTLAGFYRAAAVGLITPLRDGMNLVAKEYIAAQDGNDPGVLVLSKFAGAAKELDAALLVDPNDTEAVVRRIATALTMPQEERRARWQRNMEKLLSHSIHAWFAGFMKALKTPAPENVFPLVPARLPPLRTGTDNSWAAHS